MCGRYRQCPDGRARVATLAPGAIVVHRAQSVGVNHHAPFSDSAQLGLCVLRTASTIGSGPPARTAQTGIDAQPLSHTSRRPGWWSPPAIPRSPAQQSMAPAPRRLSTGTRFFWNICDPGIPDLGQDPCPNAATLQRYSAMFVTGKCTDILANGCVKAGTLSDRPGDSWTACGGGFLEYSQRFVLPSAAEGILIRTRRRTDTSR
ncbi:LOW QUALITY PROTEIN: hypothetical protein B0H65DRAFT_504339 [Neurospora tetraspora]|uniref:Uncharacterized protein n=1 Tax=Neurospora tetraspora TaxID=94610 RepID=A0AAE0MVQ5_9PEZI|nr:LOW QUALITY PROTEIN: hypothetical protein B0H65DRAFT_504339 [Neurospora tetraspora]